MKLYAEAGSSIGFLVGGDGAPRRMRAGWVGWTEVLNCYHELIIDDVWLIDCEGDAW